jgi:hypothetical protein
LFSYKPLSHPAAEVPAGAERGAFLACVDSLRY